MKASEILRGLADLIDKASGSSTDQTTSEFVPIQQPRGDGETPVMVPPLQTKIELLKKAVDVDSIYDNCEGGDELTQMKKMAGINPVVADEAASDEPLDI